MSKTKSPEVSEIEVDAAPSLSQEKAPESTTAPPTAPVLKFYHTENCNQRIQLDGRVFPFEPYALVAGTWMGTFATNNLEEQAILDKRVADKGSPITALKQDEYLACTKKKLTEVSRNYDPLIPTPLRTTDAQAIVVRPVVVVENPGTPEPVIKVGDPFKTVDDALTVGSVKVDPAK
jgi:hypothetical protein